MRNREEAENKAIEVVLTQRLNGEDLGEASSEFGLETVQEQVDSFETDYEYINSVSISAYQKMTKRRDKWRERTESLQAALLHEKKRNCVLQCVVMDLVMSGDLKLVANGR